jgi:hypothetical protein
MSNNVKKIIMLKDTISLFIKNPVHATVLAYNSTANYNIRLSVSLYLFTSLTYCYCDFCQLLLFYYIIIIINYYY